MGRGTGRRGGNEGAGWRPGERSGSEQEGKGRRSVEAGWHATKIQLGLNRYQKITDAVIQCVCVCLCECEEERKKAQTCATFTLSDLSAFSMNAT